MSSSDFPLSKQLPEKQGWLDRVYTWTFTKTRHAPVYLRVWRRVVRVFVIMVMEAVRAKVTIRASALTYSVILALVPMLALSTAILKGLGSGDQLKLAADRMVAQIGPRPAPPMYSEGQLVTEEAVEEKQDLTSHIYEAVDTIFAYVDKTNFAALGIFGIIGFLVVAIGVFSAVEDAMNSIWRAQKGRSIFRKIMDYVALLILLPLSINTALAGEAILASDKILSRLQTVIPIPWVWKILLSLLPFIFIVLSLMAMYLFFARTRVKTLAALSGALFASVLWFITQKVYIILQIGVSNYNAIYGSFATVPLFLVWLHLGWLIILLGATLAYAVQNQANYQPHGDALAPQRYLHIAYDLLDAVIRRFQERLPATIDHLASDMQGIQVSELECIADKLVQSGLLHTTVIKEEGHYLPATTTENLHPDEVIDVILGKASDGTPGGRLTQIALGGAKQALAKRSFPLNTT